MGNISSNPNVKNALLAAGALVVAGLVAHQVATVTTNKKLSNVGCCGACSCELCDQATCECGCPCSLEIQAAKKDDACSEKGGCCGAADDKKQDPIEE